MARVMAEELSWWADLEERMIGVVFRDRVDDDYGWNLLARDRAGRFHRETTESQTKGKLRKAVSQRQGREAILRRSVGLLPWY
jgi:hypothetical protein